MLNNQRKRELLSHAETMVRRLRGGAVDRGEVTPVTNALLLGPGSWTDRRANALAIAREAPTSWLRKRSKTTPGQLETVSEVVGSALEKYPDEEEARFLFGWALRLLIST